MNLKIKITVMALLGAIFGSLVCQAQDVPTKREMRSAWVATVWRLDWPATVISETGNAKQIAKQQQEMTNLLDSLQRNNFNAINFQVRSRCDAMYKSSFEPWSSDLVSDRGMDPGWDPLEWVVSECHKRGMECHAWLNPYRFESVKGAWSGQSGDYRKTNPDWVMDVGNASILNPGLPEVTQRICDIIREIVHNYDIDGVLFDDYFYLSGTNTSHDGDLYNAYKAQGGTLSIGNWRRDNVNRMIGAVYSTINEEKSWVRFGVSPAGIACTDASVAASYGIPRCPTGGDWQYSDIYSDPIAWVSQQNLDFISPQIYWTIGASTDYDKATKWWSMVANKWNRHLYVSHSISSLTAQSKKPGMSGIEQTAEESRGPLYASGPNNASYEEYANEVRLNREYNYDEAPGSIFYSAKYLYKSSPLFSHYLGNTVFNTKALVPAMPWKEAQSYGTVENLTHSGTKLSWNAIDNVRYTVYAFPAGMPLQNFLREPEYLLGVAYGNEYTIPAKYLAGCQYAVCVLDRYGNEYAPAVPGVAEGQLLSPELSYPAEGELAEAPFEFQWKAVEGAGEYIVEIATDANMENRVDQRNTTTNSISTLNFNQLPLNETLYWRVRACATAMKDGISAVNSFQVSTLLLSSPANNSEENEMTPTFTATIADREATLEISTKEEFEEKDIVYTAKFTGQHKVAPYYLTAANTYYARARYFRDNTEMVSPTIKFTTKEISPSAPEIAHPIDGAHVYADHVLKVSPVEGAYQLRLEVCSDNKFSPRQSYISTTVNHTSGHDSKTTAEIKIANKLLQDGVTYYARARAACRKFTGDIENSEYGPTVSFVYHNTTGITEVAAGEYFSIENGVLTALETLSSVNISDLSGVLIRSYDELSTGTNQDLNLSRGVYIVSAQANSGKITAKIIIQ